MAAVIGVLIYGLVGMLGSFLYLVWAYRNKVDDLDRQMISTTIFFFWPGYLVLGLPAIVLVQLVNKLGETAKKIADKKS
jgi:hypothetical protein